MTESSASHPKSNAKAEAIVATTCGKSINDYVFGWRACPVSFARGGTYN